MKIITNPTSSTVKIKFEGVEYSVEPKSFVEVSDTVARFWKAQHAFLEVSDKSEVVKEIKETKIVEPKEDEQVKVEVKKKTK